MTRALRYILIRSNTLLIFFCFFFNLKVELILFKYLARMLCMKRPPRESTRAVLPVPLPYRSTRHLRKSRKLVSLALRHSSKRRSATSTASMHQMQSMCYPALKAEIETITRLLDDSLEELETLTLKMRIEHERETKETDLIFAAMVLDRFCLLVFSLISIILLISFFV